MDAFITRLAFRRMTILTVVFAIVLVSRLAVADDGPMIIAKPVSADNLPVWPDGVLVDVCAENAGAHWITAHLVFPEKTDKPKKFLVYDQSNNEIQSIILPTDESEEWTRDVAGHCLSVAAPMGSSGFTVTEKMSPDPAVNLKSTFPKDSKGEYSEASQYDAIDAIPKALPGAAILRRNSNGAIVCTGFLLSKHRLITAYHCATSNRQARESMLLFNAKSPVNYSHKRKGKKVTISSSRFDYSVIELAQAADWPFEKSAWSKSALEIGVRFVILQSPQGEGLVVADNTNECFVEKKEQPGRNGSSRDFTYKCDTEAGSSGGYIFKNDSACPRIMGLHRKGVVSYENGDRNQAVDINAVVEDLRSKTSSSFPAAERKEAELVLSLIKFADCE